MKKMLFTNWHIMRVILLILAVGISYHAITTEHYFFLLFAVVKVVEVFDEPEIFLLKKFFLKLEEFYHIT